MSQPPDHFERIFDFTDFSAMQPSAQQPGQKIDQELNAARESINDTIDRLNEIQRDDGKLRSSALDTTEFTSIVNAATATATAAAASATTSASTATTQAGIATTAATNAGNSATSASGSASTATAQTAIASAAATTATTKATEASNSAASALASETSATASAATATTKAAEASGSAATATTQASNALNSANTSAAQANLASASATAAGNSATSASASAISASASAVAAAASAASIDLSAYAPLASPVFTGDARAVTPIFGDDDTSIATTAFVQAGLLGGTANARNLEVYVRNQTGSTLAAGAIVYINGATGNRPTVTLAQANNDANSAQTMGFVKTAIANNGFGFVIVSGECEGLNTSAVAEGTQLYLSPTVAGAYTTTKPVAPNHLVYVGIVIRSHPTQGVILVAVQNGYELNELHDVSAQTPANLDLLSYESSTSLWKNKTFSALGLLTSADAASTYQTLAGMSSYLTTASAASTYYPLVGNPSGFLTSVPPPTLTNLTSDISWDVSANTGRLLIAGVNDIGGGNTEARLNFTSGVPTQPATGDFWTNGTDFFYRESGSTKTIASQSYVSANYQPLSGMSSYLTTASAAATYFTIASAANKADLASPTFSGTPTLPTGTIATTQSPGNNTTAVATTAFVTTAVPAFATSTQSRAATSTTVAQSPGSEMWQMMNPGFIPIIRSSLSYAATGTMGGAAIGNYTSRMTMGTAGAASASFRTFGGSQIDQTYICVSKGYRSYIDFSRFTWCSGRFYTEDTWTDPQVSAGYYFGKANNSVNGNLARKGFGWRIYGNATAGNRTAILQVHNGTTLTDVSTSFALVAQQYFDWDIVSLGNGTVTLYINGTQYATTSAGPTGDTSYSGTTPVIWNEEFVSTGTTAGYNATFSRGLLYIAP